MTRSRGYTACQVGGWGLHTLLNIALSGAHGPPAVGWLIAGATGLGLTHVARRALRLHAWNRLPLPRLVARVLAAGLVLGLLQNTLVFLEAVFVFHVYSLREASWAGYFSSATMWSLVMGVWLTLYIAVQAVTHARRVELEHWKLEAAARSAELSFLQAQLQPHFLFNCLNGLRGLIVEDPIRAQEAVTRLSGLLRYALGARGPETVTLQRELQVVDDYLGLEAIRLEERLRVRMDVTPDALGVSVPAMLVQTLVENAIKHGIAPAPRGGEVSVKARIEDRALCLEVANTPGSPDVGAGTVDSGGVGLRNATERLRLLCGAAASLRLDQSQSTVTTARVHIPLEAA
ncbi:sensor protein [Corallococcus coralloides DSM 2259]|uniref:Sensor protein n=1 Tax=Corallococcus coralloides (strain ATCC 25202 / DSM 2259 / NBRC 100086 / M2) TaxID=1144275 RepID=H8MI96_CORCM|nr:histidine kinase [Corallococcus coralloides]AFE09284.1 sensor protein [Corallococcus coralloides DSM 2259]